MTKGDEGAMKERRSTSRKSKHVQKNAHLAKIPATPQIFDGTQWDTRMLVRGKVIIVFRWTKPPKENYHDSNRTKARITQCAKHEHKT